MVVKQNSPGHEGTRKESPRKRQDGNQSSNPQIRTNEDLMTQDTPDPAEYNKNINSPTGADDRASTHYGSATTRANNREENELDTLNTNNPVRNNTWSKDR